MAMLNNQMVIQVLEGFIHLSSFAAGFLPHVRLCACRAKSKAELGNHELDC